jgi:hypothetical protein
MSRFLPPEKRSSYLARPFTEILVVAGVSAVLVVGAALIATAASARQDARAWARAGIGELENITVFLEAAQDAADVDFAANRLAALDGATVPPAVREEDLLRYGNGRARAGRLLALRALAVLEAEHTLNVTEAVGLLGRARGVPAYFNASDNHAQRYAHQASEIAQVADRELEWLLRPGSVPQDLATAIQLSSVLAESVPGRGGRYSAIASETERRLASVIRAMRGESRIAYVKAREPDRHEFVRKLLYSLGGPVGGWEVDIEGEEQDVLRVSSPEDTWRIEGLILGAPMRAQMLDLGFRSVRLVEGGTTRETDLYFVSSR